MKHTQVILSLEAELSGLELEITNYKNAITDPLMTTREVKAAYIHINDCEQLVKQYKSAIKKLQMFDEIFNDEVQG